MDLEAIRQFCGDFLADSGMNRVGADAALRPELAGTIMFDAPLAAVADADDPLFEELRRPEAVGPHFRLPRQWLPEAASVVSLFLPYARPVSLSNREDELWPSPEWLHARIEGQEMIDALCLRLVERLEAAGHRAVAPALHPDFAVMRNPLSSNWSERHVGFVAGLGTFGLSAVFISEKGAAGRMASVVTSLALPPTERGYDRHDAYCTHCGACLTRCVHGALTKEGKNKNVCSAFVNNVSKKKYDPRYGCGKCYVKVPCESRIPAGAGR